MKNEELKAIRYIAIQSSINEWIEIRDWQYGKEYMEDCVEMLQKISHSMPSLKEVIVVCMVEGPDDMDCEDYARGHVSVFDDFSCDMEKYKKGAHGDDCDHHAPTCPEQLPEEDATGIDLDEFASASTKLVRWGQRTVIGGESFGMGRG